MDQNKEVLDSSELIQPNLSEVTGDGDGSEVVTKDSRKRQGSWYSNLFPFWSGAGQEDKKKTIEIEQPKKKKRIEANTNGLLSEKSKYQTFGESKPQPKRQSQPQSQSQPQYHFKIEIPSEKDLSCLEIRPSSQLNKEPGYQNLNFINKSEKVQSIDGWTLRSKEDPGEYSRLFGIKPLQPQVEHTIPVIMSNASVSNEFSADNRIIWPKSKITGNSVELVDCYGNVRSITTFLKPILPVKQLHGENAKLKITEEKKHFVEVIENQIISEDDDTMKIVQDEIVLHEARLR